MVTTINTGDGLTWAITKMSATFSHLSGNEPIATLTIRKTNMDRISGRGKTSTVRIEGVIISGGEEIGMELKARSSETIIGKRGIWTIGIGEEWMGDGIGDKTIAISHIFKEIGTESMILTSSLGSEKDTNTTKQEEKERTELCILEATTSILQPMTHLT